MKKKYQLQKNTCLIILLTICVNAKANIYSVTSAADSGPGTLRDAIFSINISPLTSTADPYIIDLGPIDGSLITIASDLPEIKNFVRIIATTNVTISCQSLYMAFLTRNPDISVWFKNLTVAKAKNAFTNMGSSIFLDHCFVNGCNAPDAAPNGGGMFNNGYAELSRCTFNGCSAINGGGGNIDNFQNGILLLKDSCQILRGNAQTGGGIYSDGKVLVTEGSLISRNSATISGGGIVINSLNPDYKSQLVSAQITNNTAPAAGGIYAGSNTDILSNTNISRNTASSGNGGGLYIHASVNVNLDSSFIQISNNTAGVHGGGVFMESNTLTKFFTNVEIENNESLNGNGGGVYITDGFFTFNGCSIKSNKANLNGGGIYSGAGLFLMNTQFGDNRTSTQDGGGLYINNANATINPGCTFTNNRALLGKGGAVYNGIGLLSITGTSFTGNNADDGAVLFSVAQASNPVTIESCTITNNTSARKSCLLSENGFMNISNTPMTGNTGLLNVSRHYGKYVLDNCFIYNNTRFCKTSGSVSDVSLNNCTVINNTDFSFDLGSTNHSFTGCLFDNNDRLRMDNSIGTSGKINMLRCTFQNYYRGVIYCVGSDATPALIADSCIFQNNADTVTTSAYRTLGNSGVIALQSSSAIFNHCFFTGNNGNAATADGGVISILYNSASGITISNSTFSNNHANRGSGGAISTSSRVVLNLTNCTFSGNTAAYRGGAISSTIYGYSGAGGKADINIKSCTFVLNSLSVSSATAIGGALWTDSCRYDISNTIIAGNTRGGGIIDDIVSGYRIRSQYKKNLFTSINAPIVGGAYNTVASAAQVINTTLGFNGGFTPTHLLAINSPALDFCLNGTTPSTDQRGVTRDLFPDCGSVEGSFPSTGGGTGGGGKLIAKTSAPVLLKVYPNPASSEIHISYNSIKTKEVSFIISDMNGKIVYQTKQQINAGSNTITMDISKYAAGSYIITTINAAGEKRTMKFVKQ